MNYITALIIGKILDYVASHADEIIDAIKDKFLNVSHEPDVKDAIHKLARHPSEETLASLGDVLKSKGEDPAQLAALLVNKATVV